MKWRRIGFIMVVGLLVLGCSKQDEALKLYNKACEYHAKEMYGLAAQHYKLALDIDPLYADAEAALGRIYLKIECYGEARDRLTIAWQLYKDYGVTYVKGSTVDEEISRLVTCLGFIEMEEAKRYLIKYGECDLSDRHLVAGYNLFLEALRLDPGNATAREMRSRIEDQR